MQPSSLAHHSVAMAFRSTLVMILFVMAVADVKHADKAAHLRVAGAPAAAPPPDDGPGISYNPERAKVLETMKHDDALPEQGFQGSKVSHEDKETMVGDWRTEFGPKGPTAVPEPKKAAPAPKKVESGAGRAGCSALVLLLVAFRSL
eukprot:gnl/TRDRNA2_/TRDRNA2_181921_c0_seq1.p1 gnl/TRDRNA2_/TRDRNA2_181921_c0~~gnl/TRDRNA2_/TRDRNA2_181921_c0_seq1.p1  ORF type:complete len:147 (-),score=32.28 gnl/TRDRNA2_/TRDRNA2_181921_c0_seq1:128-568(-)